MGRVERRMYKRRRGQVLLRRVLLGLTLAVIAVGVIGRMKSADSVIHETVAPPTATPVTSAWDRSVQTREIVLEETVWHAVQTGIFSAREAAEAKAGAYTDRGAPGYVWQDGSKYRVFIACYGREDDASAVRSRLSTQQFVETYLHTWTCPAVTLRLTGMAGQLDVAEAGLSLTLQAAQRLRDAAARMDRGEYTSDEAWAEVEAVTEQHRLWMKTAQERFAKPYPVLLETELTQAQQWQGRRDVLLEAYKSGATALSAALKQQGMDLYAQAAHMRISLQDE